LGKSGGARQRFSFWAGDAFSPSSQPASANPAQLKSLADHIASHRSAICFLDEFGAVRSYARQDWRTLESLRCREMFIGDLISALARYT
jgi:hypothetical protein